eukprot:365685-Rhodomonas_salina.1
MHADMRTDMHRQIQTQTLCQHHSVSTTLSALRTAKAAAGQRRESCTEVMRVAGGGHAAVLRHEPW